MASFDGVSWNTWNPIDDWGYASSNIDYLDTNQDGNLLFQIGGDLATYDLKEKKWTFFKIYGNSFVEGGLHGIKIDNNDEIWVRTSEIVTGNFFDIGLYWYHDSTWTLFDTTNTPIRTNTIYFEHMDNNGNIWLANYANNISRLYKFDGDTTWTEYTPYNTGLSGDKVSTIFTDNINTKWIATDYGISQYTGKMPWGLLDTFNTTQFLINEVTTITQDSKGVIWAGSKNWDTKAGLYKYENQNWTIYNTSNSDLPNIEIYDLEVDKTGSLWIGGASGVTEYDGTTWTTYDKANSILPDNHVTAITFDKNEGKWFGTQKGLVLLTGSTWTIYDSSNTDIPNNWITSLAFDTNDVLWVGTLNGVASFNGSSWTAYNSTNSDLPNNYINNITADSFGNVWIGTNGGGVAKFNGANWTVYDSSNSDLTENRVTAISIDKDGSKWFGTKENGVSHLIDGDTLTSIEVAKKSIEKYSNIKFINNTITANIIKSGSVKINIYDIRGRLIKSIFDGNLNVGVHKFNLKTSSIANGVYLLNMKRSGRSISQKITISR